MAKSKHARLAGALAGLALAGCAGARYEPAPPGGPAAARHEEAPAENVLPERAEEAAARASRRARGDLNSSKVAATPPAGHAAGPPRRGVRAPPAAAPSAADASRREDARADAGGQENAGAAVAGGSSPAARGDLRSTLAPEEPAKHPAADGLPGRRGPDPVRDLSFAAEAPGAPEDAPAGGGAGVWFLGILLAGGIAGGGWLALQPKWVRRRVWRSLRAAPGRILARLRGARAGEPAGTTAWKSAPSTWRASDGEAPPGLAGPRRRTGRARGKLTNATLPAFRAAGEDDPDGPTE